MSALKILIADDDPTARRFLQAALHKLEHECILAVDGHEAWEAYQATQPRAATTRRSLPKSAASESASFHARVPNER